MKILVKIVILVICTHFLIERMHDHFKQHSVLPIEKNFESADCDTIYTIHLFLCELSADPNPFRGTHCIQNLNLRNRVITKLSTILIILSLILNLEKILHCLLL